MTAWISREAEGEVEFTQYDFERVRTMLKEWAGIALNDMKQPMVYSRLSRTIRSRGNSSFKAYLDDLEGGADPNERTRFINALTTNLTSFFRENYHFPILAGHLRAVARAESGPIRIWCSAASTGEEPYSIAMTAVETLRRVDPNGLRILASDIDTEVLAHAQAGIYASERVSKLDPQQLRRHFLNGRNQNNGFVKVRPELQRLVEFKQINLLDPRWPIDGAFDVIFCRNVMIYFDRSTQAKVIKRMVSHLKMGGLLFAGHSENFQNVSDQVRLCGRTVYQRVAASRSASLARGKENQIATEA